MGKKNKKKTKNQDRKLNSDTPIATKNLIVQQGGEDFISPLPDDILCRVISLLPFESSVKTSFLSTRWKGLWKMAAVQNGTIEDATSVISSFLTDYNELASSKRCLQFNFGRDNVLLAVVAPKNKLHLDFSTGRQEFPRQFGWLLELKLTRKPFPHTFFVRSLYLISVSYLTNEAVSTIVSNLPFLENLTVAKCNGLRYLCIDDGSSNLKKLTILDCLQLKSLRIKAPGLHSFRCQGLLPWFWPEGVFYLGDAMLDFRRGLGYNNIKSHDFHSTFLSMISVRSLTLCRWVFEALICPGLPLGCCFSQIRELWWIDYLKEPYNSDALISFLKLCPSLEKLFVTIDPKSYFMPIENACSNKIRRSAQLGNLKFIKLDGFTNQEEEMLLAVQLEELASVKPKIVATSNERRSLRRLVKVPQSQEGKLPYKFVEDVKHKNESCPKHAHMKYL